MPDATEVSAAPRLQRAHGAAAIGFAAGGDGVTRLATLAQRSPYRVLLPDGERGDPPTAIVLMTAGGIAGGDRLELGLQVGPGAAACVAGQAAERAYRSTGAVADSRIGVSVAAGGRLEWLPQETIFFNGCRLRRQVTIDLAPSARLLAVDMLVFGRVARGERWEEGLIADRWLLRRGGATAWADALDLSGQEQLDHPAGFAGAKAYATIVYAGPDAASHLDLARTLLEGRTLAGATVVGGVLVIRLLGAAPQELRASVTRVLAGLRQGLFGLAPRLPRVWYC